MNIPMIVERKGLITNQITKSDNPITVAKKSEIVMKLT
jgi:hypothetical protein